MVQSNKAKVLRGSASNFIRLVLSAAISLFLPHFLVHRMSPAEYSAWVLILQLSAYVTFLDLGIQTAIGKFVAEYDAKKEPWEAEKLVSSAFLLLSAASICGVLLVVAVSLRVPNLFHQMPPSLWSDVRIGLLAIGVSIAIGLPLSIFSSIFVGLQEYTFPTAIAVISRVASTVAIMIVLLMHRSLAAMALTLAAFNVLTAVAGFAGWRRLASRRVPFRFPLFDRTLALKLGEYCGVLAIWTLAMLLISGLDTTLVGHYDYASTGAYAAAASMTNFMMMLISNLVSPLMPAASSLGANRSAAHMGNLLQRVSRYNMLLLLGVSLPLFIGGYTLLRLWLGADYAQRGTPFLRILILANVIRYLVYPYCLMVVAAGKQRYASVSPIAESVINLVASVLLARRFGAIGVALGTLIGAGFGVTLHAFISMRATQDVLAFRRSTLLLHSIARPALVVLPSLALYSQWGRQYGALLPMSPLWLFVWAGSTLAIAWQLTLEHGERNQLLKSITHRLGWTPA
jgi:O-antigen/teichoic acid export membrane protein